MFKDYITAYQRINNVQQYCFRGRRFSWLTILLFGDARNVENKEEIRSPTQG